MDARKKVEKKGFINKMKGIFGNPNFLKAIPLIIGFTVIASLSTLPLLFILPLEFLSTEIPWFINTFAGSCCCLLCWALLWIIYGKSTSFKKGVTISLCPLLGLVVSFLMQRMGSNVSALLIFAPPATMCIILTILHVTYSTATPLKRISEENYKVSSCFLDEKEIGLTNYGQEFEEVDNSFVFMKKAFIEMLGLMKDISGDFITLSSSLTSHFDDVLHISEEITINVQEVTSGAANQAETASKGIVDTQNMETTVFYKSSSIWGDW